MQYQVPQFIERKARILGPLTLGQSIYLSIAGGSIYILSLMKINFYIFIFASLLIGISAMALAFLEIEGRPLPKVIGSALGFFIGPKTFVWKRTPKQPVYRPREEKIPLKEHPVPPTQKILKQGTSGLQRLGRRIESGLTG